MERHLKTLSDKLESMKADKKKDKHGKKSKSSSKHSKARSEVSAPTSTSSEKKKHKRSRQVISSSEDEDDMDVVRVKEKVPLITLDQQKELSNTINNFTGQELADVIQIIHDSMPHLKVSIFTYSTGIKSLQYCCESYTHFVTAMTERWTG